MTDNRSDKIADVQTEKLKHPIINSDRATATREDGEQATAKGKNPADAAQKAADKVERK
jgi:hypothetical protein